MKVAHPDTVQVAGTNGSNTHIALLGTLDPQHTLESVLQLAAGSL